MAKYPYKQLGVKLDRDYRNALNDNFKDIETDLVTEKQRVDNALSEQKDRVDTLITEVEQPSEVVDSRGGFTVLRDRLDDSDTQLAENTDKLLKKDAIGIAYLTEYGNITTGANVTVAANAATDDLLAKYGGGTILYPVGSFVAEGIKVKNGIKHIGANMIGTRLKLPNTSSNHIFVGETDEVLDGGGIYDFELVGNALGTDHNGIDLSACSRANSYYIQDNYIHHFNIGVKSTKNDRQLIAQGNRIWSNDIGWYVILNHPTFGINDIRDNRIGLGGETLYDIQMFGTRFVYNDYGIKANNFSGSHLSSVFFFKNSVQSLEINDDMNVNGCLFVPNDTNDVGIYIKGYYNNVTGNTFRKEDTKKFGNTAILLYEPDHSSVTNNNFECNGRILTFQDTVEEVEQFNFEGNLIEGINMSIKAEGSRMIKYSTFNHNKFYFENETNMIDPVIEIPNSFYGNDFINNKLIARPNAVVGKSMRIDGRNGTITLNRQTQNFGEIEVTASNANTLNENNMKFA